MRVLLTGATGFIGSAAATHLRDQGLEVISVGGPGSRGTAAAGLFACDVCDAADMEKLLSVGEVDAIVHAAGLAHRFKGGDPQDFASVNSEGVRNIAGLAAKLKAKHFVLFSSVLVYGETASRSTVEISEDTPCLPKDTYGESKFKGEQAASEVCENAQLSLTILRLVPTIGEGSKGNFARLIRAIDRRMFIRVGRGENRKSMVYVGDVARAVETVLQMKKAGVEIFNISAPAAAMKDIVDEIARTLDRRLLPITIPGNAVAKLLRAGSGISPIRRVSDTMDKWLSDEVYSGSRIEQAYGFKPETSILEAARLDTAFYLENARSNRKR